MKPLDVLTALDQAGDRATQGEWTTAYAPGDVRKPHLAGWPRGVAICSVAPRQRVYSDTDGGSFPAADETFIATAANARPALKAHLAAVAKLVEAARRLLNGGDCTCDPAVAGSRTDFCGACEMRAALKEVTS